LRVHKAWVINPFEAYGNSKRQAEAAVAKEALDNMKSKNA